MKKILIVILFFNCKSYGQVKPNNIIKDNKQDNIIKNNKQDNISKIVIAAYRDAIHLRLSLGKKAVFYRYLWWTEDWKDAVLLTKAQQNLLSTKGFFAIPIVITHDPLTKEKLPGYLIRLNTCESGWDVRLDVWEKFADIDFVFHQKEVIVSEKTFIKYYPPGYYNNNQSTTNNKSTTNNQSTINNNTTKIYYDCSNEELTAKSGETIIQPAMWANPLTTKYPIGKEKDNEHKDNKHNNTSIETKVSALDELRKLLCTEVPILLGQWWLIQTQRQISTRNKEEGVGYYEWFGIKNRNDYFNVVGVKEQDAIDRYQEWREIITRSGISNQNRQIFLLRGTTGFVWGTLDTFKQEGRGIAKRNLRRGEFDADAEEYIGHLPNKLPIVSLVSSKDVVAIDQDGKKVVITKAGSLQATAPDKIGPDNSDLNKSQDLRVHSIIGCFRCHGTNKDYIKPFDGWARRTFIKGRAILEDPDPKVLDELKSNYLRNIQSNVEKDRKEYVEAFAELTINLDGKNDPKDVGLTVAEFTKIYCEAWNQYVVDNVTVDVAAGELGFTKEQFIAGLIKHNSKDPKDRGRGNSDLVIGEFIPDKEGKSGKITRLDWESSYQYAHYIVRGIEVPDILKKVKGIQR